MRTCRPPSRRSIQTPTPIGNTGYAYGYLSGKFSSTATSYLGLWDAILNEGAIGSVNGVEYLYNSDARSVDERHDRLGGVS